MPNVFHMNETNWIIGQTDDYQKKKDCMISQDLVPSCKQDFVCEN